MKNAFLLLFVFSLLLIVAGCGGSKSIGIDEGSEWTEVSDPLKDLTISANEIIDLGGVAAIGEGRSTRRDLAKQKATANAEANLARIFERKVESLSKNFQEEVGQGRRSEINELFSSVSKTISKKVLTGAFTKDYKVMQNDRGEYLYGILLAVTPKSVNMSLLDEMQNQNKELYQRFRASKAFEELQKEMASYEG
jgi:ribosomal protein S20